MPIVSHGDVAPRAGAAESDILAIAATPGARPRCSGDGGVRVADGRASCLTHRMADCVLAAGRPPWRIAPVSSASACGLARQSVTP